MRGGGHGGDRAAALVKSGTDARGRYTRDEKGGNPMNFKHLLDIRLNLFDGGGAAGGAGAGAAASGDGAPGTQGETQACLLYTSPSPRDMRRSRMPSSA